MRAAILLALAVAGSGCAAARPACRSGTAVGWREVRTAHFVVRTDTDVPALLVAALEAVHERVRAVMALPPAAATAPIEVVAFRSRREYEDHAPGAAGAFTHLESLGKPRIVFAFGGEGGTAPFGIAREVARVALQRALPGQPRWLALGAPWYVAANAVDPWRAPAAGNTPGDAHREATQAGVEVRDLLSADGALPAGASKLAWVLVQYLSEVHPERMGRLLRALPTAADPADPFREEFPEWAPATGGEPERLQAALAEWVAVPPRPSRIPSRPPDVAWTARELGSADVHALRLSLPRRGDAREQQAARIAEAEELLAERAADPGALVVLAAARRRDPDAAARLAVEAHPCSPLAWGVLADRYPEGSADRISALRKGLELDPDAAALSNNLAWALHERGNLDEALWHARRAVAVAPWHFAYLDTLAEILADLGYCTEGLAWQRRGLEAARVLRSPRTTEYQERLARLVARCGAAEPSPPRHGAAGAAPVP